jgi:hypothetical protein
MNEMIAECKTLVKHRTSDLEELRYRAFLEP